jgi:two-component system, chemotaxis family, protein-glutamate methylesterase/glutaminase
MAPKRLVVIGASSGGLEALQIMAAALPPDFPAAICVVLHIAPHSPGLLEAILARAGPLPAVRGQTGLRIQPGHIYVAPPDHHLLVEPGVLRVTRGPRENRFRPAIDPLFRSAAQVYGPASVGVILTGDLDDGTAGLWTVKRLGGVAIVQDPEDALFPSMPRNALQHVDVDVSVRLREIAPLLVRVTAAPAEDRKAAAVPDSMEIEMKIAGEENAVDAGLEQVGEPSPFACPECHGVLLRLKEKQPLRFRCHTGHAFSAESLLAAIDEGIEDALWNAVRALEEGGLLLQQMAANLEEHAHTDAVRDLATRAVETRRRAETLRDVATGRRALTAVPRQAAASRP